MPPQILELNSHQPIKGEQYFVDTNVWFWTTYVASNKPKLPQIAEPYQIADYPAFLERALDIGAILCHCPLTLAELANVIENTEFDIYKKNTKDTYLTKKGFRKILTERQAVIGEIQVAWDSINAMSKCLEIKLDLNFVNQGCDILREGTVDAYDAFFIQITRDNYIDYVITDDQDFSTIKKQILITSNPNITKK